MPTPPALSRRERQVLDVLHRLGRATAAEVRAALEDPPSDSAVRTHLRILEEKGHATHEQDGPRYVYLPAVATEKAGKGALQHLVKTFYEGAPLRAAAALLDDGALTDSDLDRLAALIEQARTSGR
ncbi:BlaI/MecI/CopY family transcriptional regulator [Rubricoccus marinus]|uniref:CopY family transcriptional regulator n=1 Tax=Rubricoccus marinus TaxID=716817 RepID=A0A259TWJ2_9BACT|nr:BlaI/MecI/CopY family transcriptional regulator [Rubricoccus marinus]OZC02123.1 CopY family transcriptional regulator [Rubricoccus marinus]